MPGYVYIMTNRPRGTLYTGVTRDVNARAWIHKRGINAGFTNQYRLRKLVYVEEHFDIRDAIIREKQLKRYRRQWKIELMESINRHGVIYMMTCCPERNRSAHNGPGLTSRLVRRRSRLRGRDD
jgi:putative endonuclease